MDSWFGEFAVVLGEMPFKHDLCLGWGFRSRSSEFTDQPVLEGSPQSLDSAFGLRRTCWDEGDPELLQASADLGSRPLILQLLLDCRFSVSPKDRVTVGIDLLRQSVLVEDL